MRIRESIRKHISCLLLTVAMCAIGCVPSYAATTYDTTDEQTVSLKKSNSEEISLASETAETDRTVAYFASYAPSYISGFTSATKFVHNTTITDAELQKKISAGTAVRIDENRSNANETYKIYGWVDNGTIYWWTNADMAGLNASNKSMFTCTSLLNISLKDIDTNSLTSMSGMFRGQSALVSVDMSGLDTSNVTDMSDMFSYCSKLVSVDLSGANTSNVTNMDRMFNSCTQLTSIVVSNSWDTSNVSSSSNMFYGTTKLPNYTSLSVDKTRAYAGKNGYLTGAIVVWADNMDGASILTSINDIRLIKGFKRNANISDTELQAKIDAGTAIRLDSEKDNADAEYKIYGWLDSDNILNWWSNASVTRITDTGNRIFSDLSNCESISLDGIDTSKMTNMARMFSGDSAAKSIDVSSIDTGAAINMSEMFKGCSALTSLDVSSFDTNNVTNMNYMFDGCSGLTELNICNFDTDATTKMQGMFRNCSVLNNIYVSSLWETENVKSSTEMFAGDTALPHFMNSYTDKTKAYVGEDGYLTETAVDWGSNYADHQTILYYVTQKAQYFYPSGLKGFKRTYQRPTDLIDIGIAIRLDSDRDNENAEYKIYGWLDSNNVLNWWSNAGKTHLTDEGRYLFYGLSGCIDISLKDIDTSKMTAMDYMFGNNSSLVALDASGFDTSAVTQMYNMFEGCTQLANLDVSSFNTEQVTHMAYMFKNCSSLTSLNLSSFDTSKAQYMYDMFDGCQQLEHIYVSSLWSTKSVTSSSNMFRYATNLPNFTSSYVDKTRAYVGENGYLSEASVEWGSNVDEGTLLTLITDTKNIKGFKRNSSMSMVEVEKMSRNGTAIRLDSDKNNDDAEFKIYGWIDFEGTLNWWSNATTTYLTNDGNLLFSGLTNCKDISLDGIDVSKITAMNNIFSGDAALLSINVSGFNTSTVEDMSGLFNGCAALTKLDLINFDTQSVTNMASMFNQCSSLETVYVSSMWTTDSVTKSENMFNGATKLPNFTQAHTDKSRAYAGEDGYFITTEVTWGSNVNNASELSLVTNLYNITEFKRNTTITGNELQEKINSGAAVRLDSGKENADAEFKIYGWLDSNNALNWWSNAGTAYITDDGQYLFRNLPNCKKISLSCIDVSRLTSMDNMFASDVSLEALDLNRFDTSAATSMDSMFYYCNSLSGLDASNFDTSKVTNMSNMFYYCCNLTELDLSNFDTAKVTNMNKMFWGCSKLEKLRLKNFDTSAVTNMNAMFAYCNTLDALNLSSFDTKAVTDTTEMFARCNQLENIYVSSKWNTGNISKSYDMFSLDTKLPNYNGSYINVAKAHVGTDGYLSEAVAVWGDNIDNDSVLTLIADKTNIKGFKRNTSISNKKLQEKIESKTAVRLDSKQVDDFEIYGWLDDNGTINWWSNTERTILTNAGNRLFYGLHNCSNIELKDICTSKMTGMKELFKECSSLSSLDISGLDISAVTDMSEMFSGCTSLTTLDLSYLDTSAVTNMSGMLSGCSKLTSLNLQGFKTDAVTDMSNMFANCSQLQDVYVSLEWTTKSVNNSEQMFVNAVKLPNFSETFIDKTKAYTGKDGYFIQTTVDWGNNISTKTDDSDYIIKDSTLTLVTDVHTILGFKRNFTISHEDLQTMVDNGTAIRLDSDRDNVYAKFKIYGWLDSDNVLNWWSNAGTSCLMDAGNHLFYDLYGCKEISLDWIDTSKMTDMNEMFYRCAEVETLDVSQFDTSNVTNMCGMFDGAQSVKTLNLSNFDTSNVTNMCGMFAACHALSSLDISNFDTSKVTDMSTMFWQCWSFETLDLSNLDTSSATDMSRMFYWCRTLRELNVSSFDTSKVTDMAAMFSDCWAMEKLDVSNFDTSQVTRMYEMFHGCIALTDLDVTNFNTKKVETMSDMFFGCVELQSLDVSSFETDSVTDISSMFESCAKITALDLSNFNTSSVYWMNGMFANCSSLKTLDISSFDTRKVKYMSRMFFGCDQLEKIYISSLWDTAETKKYSSPGNDMFYADKWLPNYTSEYVDITRAYAGGDGYLTEKAAYWNDNVDGSSVLSRITDINNISEFTRNTSITEDELQKKIDDGTAVLMGVDRNSDIAEFKIYAWLDSDGVLNWWTNGLTTYITDDGNRLFNGLQNCTNISLDGINTSKMANMNYLFADCSSLKELTIPDLSAEAITKFTTKGVTDMSYMFNNCSALKDLDLSSFDTSVVTNMAGMFKGCSTLSGVNLQNFDTGLTKDMSQMFADCSAITEIDTSKFNTAQVTNMSQMFSGVSKVSMLDLSNFVTENTTNMSSMFANCPSLRVLKLTSFDTSNVAIIDNMFNENTRLSSLTIGVKTNLSGANLQSPYEGEGTSGKWTLANQNNHDDALTATELMVQTTTEDGAAGTWVAELNATAANIKIALTDTTTAKTGLNGTFAIYSSGKEPLYCTTDADGNPSYVITVKDGSSDEIESDLFVEGSYYLVQLSAPIGFAKNPDQEFVISSSDIGTTKTLEVTNAKDISMPETGSNQAKALMQIALALIACGSVVAATGRKQRRS